MKNKGFTLVELLGVIVILSILVLLATPAVTNIITKSQKNTFKNEVLSMAKIMESVYSEKANQKILNYNTSNKSEDYIVQKLVAVQTIPSNQVYKITFENYGYRYLCMSLSELVDGQYLKKDLSEGVGGYIQMWVSDGNQGTRMFVNTTNSKFYLQGYLEEISKSDFQPTIRRNTLIDEPTESTECPYDVYPPDWDIHNLQENE